MTLKLLLLTALVAGAFAGPISFSPSTTTCAHTCPDTADTRYAVGTTYQYDYVSRLTTSIPMTTEDESTLTLEAKVYLEVLAPCEMALRMSDVSLKDADPSGSEDHVTRAFDFKRAVQERALRFSMVNGRVEELCPDETEEAWVLNIKRAVLSGLQMTVNPATINDVTSVTETDVSGECEVAYTKTGTGVFTKAKDLLACKGRQDSKTIFQGIPYDVPSHIQSLPILRSEQSCRMELDSADRVTTTICSESHTFRPFAKDNSGARTVVEYSLTLATEDAAVMTPMGEITTRTNMLFEHFESADEQEVTRRDAVQTLNALCDQTEGGVRPETPALFSTLVKQMRKLDTDTLTSLSGIAMGGRLCTKAGKFFQDALPSIATPASLSVMRDMIQTGVISGTEADMWLTSLTFINTPSKDMLAVLLPLLDGGNPKAVLAISSMVHSYCHTTTGCADEPEVSAVLAKIVSLLNADCSADHDTVLMALKGLGNAGEAQAVVPTLNSCFRNAQLPIEVRVAAVNAFRRMECKANMDEVTSFFLNAMVDSELRINAYLMLMQCPTHELLNQIYSMLEREEVNQVGSFVWTHLTNLMETSNPLKQDIARILDHHDLQTAFNVDKRKFSRNVELSGFSELLNAGASVDSNLIWSTKSFMPRAATVNLTMDLFGQSVNLMEVGGRVEGMDSILESIFGPDSEENETPNRRSVINPSYIDAIDNKYRVQESNDPQGSYFLRVFGSEIRYDDFHGLDLDSIKDKFNYLQWLIDLSSDHDYEFTKSFVLLDTELCVPTMAGLPLKLKVDGTTVMDLKLKGKMDLRHMPRSIDVTGILRPSAAVLIEASMGVDAWVASTGLKMTNTFHTSTRADGSLTLQDGKIFNMDINMPEEQMEIFNAESKFFITYRNTDREQSMVSERMEAEYCLDNPKLVKMFGMELCGAVSLPVFSREGAPMFPLTGPSSASITLNKRDTFSQYHMEGKILSEKLSRGVFNYIAFATFNTPGSAVDRELTLDFDLNQGENSVRCNIHTPWKKVDISGSMVNTAESKTVSGRMMFDDVHEYTVSAEMQKTQTRYNTKIDTTATLSLPNRAPFTFTGMALYRPSKRLQIDLALKNVMETPMKLKAEFTQIAKNDQHRIEADVSVRGGNFKGQVFGSMDNVKGNSELISDSRVEVKYKFDGSNQETITLNERFHLQTPAERQQASLSSSMASSLWPQYDTDLSVMVTKEYRALGGSFQLGLTNDKPKRIDMSAHTTYDFMRSDKTVDATASFSLPHKNWAYEVEVKHTHNNNELQSTGLVKYNGEEAKTEINLKKESLNPISLSAMVSAVIPGHEMMYRHSLQERTPNVYHHDLTITLDRNDEVVLTSTYTKGGKHIFTAELKTPIVEPIKIEAALKPVITDMEAMAKVTFLESVYGVAGNWQHTTSSRDTETKVEFEIEIPERKSTFDGEFKLRSNTMTMSSTTKWDVQRDLTKKITTDATILLSSTTPTIQLKSQWWPNKFVEINGNMRLRGNLEGSLRAVSSFPGYEELSGSFTHEMTTGSIRSHAEASWAASQRITTDLNLSKVNGWTSTTGYITINTPFTALHHLKLESTQALERNALTTNTKVEWNEDQMALEVSGALGSGRMANFDVKFASPFIGYQSLRMKGNHNDDGQQYNTNMEFHQNGQIYAMKFNMMHERNGLSVTNSGELSYNLPFQTKLTWSHDNNQREIKTHAEFELEGERSVLDIKGKLRRVKQLSATLRSAYVPNMGMAISHEGRSIESMKNSVELTYDSQTMKLENEFGFSGQQLTVKSKFTSPLQGFELITLDMDDKIEGDRFVAQNELKWGTNQKIALSVALSQDMPRFEGDIGFMSPFTESLSIYVSNKKMSGLWVLSNNIQYGERKLVESTYKLGMESKKMVSLTFKSTCPYMENLEFSAEYEGQMRNFRTIMEMNHSLVGRMSMNMMVDTQDMKDSKIDININTPFDNFESIQTTLSHNGDDRHGCETEFTLRSPLKNIKLSQTNRYEGLLDFSTNTHFEYDNERMQLYVKHTPTLFGIATFNSTFTYPKMVQYQLEGPWNAFKSQAIIGIDANERITGDLEFSISSGPNIKISTKLTTPFPELNILELTINHQHGDSHFSNSLQAQVNEFEISGASELTETVSTNTLNGQISLRTNMDMLKKAEAIFDLRRHSQSFSGSVDTYEQTYSIRDSLSKNGNELTMTVEVSIPDTYSLSLTHSGPPSDFTNTLTIHGAGETMTMGSEFKFSGSDVELSLTATTPFVGCRDVGLTYTHRGSMSNFNCNLNAHMDNKRISGVTTFKFTGTVTDLDIEIETPFQGYNTLGYSFKQTPQSANAYENTMRMHIENQVITFTSQTTFNNYWNAEGTIQVETPFEVLRSLNINIGHHGSAMDYNNELSIRYNSGSFITFESAWKLIASGMEAHMKLDSSCPRVRSVEMQLKHSGPISDFNNEASLAINGEQGTIGSKFSYERRSMEGSVSLTTPFNEVEKLEASFRHTGHATNFRNDATVIFNDMNFSGNTAFKFTRRKFEIITGLNTPNNEASLSLQHMWESNKFENELTASMNQHSVQAGSKFDISRDAELQAEFTVTTTHESFRKLAATMETKGYVNDCTNVFTGTFNDQTIVYNSAYNYRMDRNALEMSHTLTTPVPGYERIAMNINHNGGLTVFSNTINVALNDESISSHIESHLSGNQYEGSVRIATPFDAMRTFTFNANHKGPWNNMENEMSYSWNTQTVSANTAFSLNGNEMEGSLRLTSPWKNIVFTDKHNGPWFNMNNEMTLSLDGIMYASSDLVFKVIGNALESSLRLTSPHGNVYGTVIHSGHVSNFKNEVSFSINGERMVESNTAFELTGNELDCSFQLTSPLVNLQIGTKHDGDMLNFNNEMEVVVNGQTASIANKIKRLGAHFDGSVIIRTPFDGYNTMSLEIKHQEGQFPSFESEIRGEIDNKVLMGKMMFYTSGNEIKSSLLIQTPFEDVSDLGLDFSHTGGHLAFEQHLSVGFNGEKASLDSSFKAANKIEGHLKFLSPWGYVESGELEFDFSGTLTDFNNNMMVKVNDHTYSGKSVFQLQGSMMHAEVAAFIPQEYSLVIDHSGPLGHFSNSFNMKIHGLAVNGNGELSVTGNGIDALLSVTTPKGTNRASFSHEGSFLNFHQRSNIEYFGKAITHQAELSVDGRRVNGKLAFTSPCPYLQSFTLAGNHAGVWNSFENSAMIELNGKSMESSSGLTFANNKLTGSISVQMPQEYSISFTHKGVPTDFTNNVHITLHEDSVDANTAFKVTGDSLEASSNIRSTFQGYRNFVANMNYKKENGHQVSASLRTPFNNFENTGFTFSLQKSIDSFEFEGKIDCPYGLPEITIEAQHVGFNIKKFNNQGRIEFGGEHFQMDSSFLFTTTKVEAVGHLMTPFECISNMNVNFNFQESGEGISMDASAGVNGELINGAIAMKHYPDFDLTGSLVTPFEAMRDLKINMNHRGSVNDFASSGNMELNGDAMHWDVTHKMIGMMIESSGSLTTPITNHGAYSFNINNNGDPQDLVSTGTIRTPHGEYAITLKHKGDLNDFETELKVDTPYPTLPSVLLKIGHQGSADNFRSNARLEYNNEHVQGDITYRRSPKILAHLTIESSFDKLRDFEIMTEHEYTSSSLIGKIDATCNGIKYADLDYAVGFDGSRSASVNVRAPGNAASAVRYNSQRNQRNGEASFSWGSSTYATSFDLRNTNELMLTVSLPESSVQMTTSYELTNEKFSHKTELQWDNDESSKMSYEIEVTRASRSRQNIYDGRVILTNRMGTLQTTFNHKVNPGRRYVTEVKIQELTLKSDLLLKQASGREFTTTFTVKHPEFTNDVILMVEGAIEPEKPRFEGKMTLEYADQKFEFTGHIADESASGSDRRYVAEAHLTHPASALDVQFSTALTNNQESMGGNMEVSYMMARDRQLKNAALRAQINKIRDELNMEVSTPVKRMSVTGRRVPSASNDGHLHYTVSGNVDDRELRAEFDVDRQSPSIDMRVHYDEQHSVHVYGKYVDDSTLKFEAYHEKDGSREQDSELSLRLSNKNTLSSRAYLRPSLIHDIQELLSTDTEFGSALAQIQRDVSDELEIRSAAFQRAFSPIQESAGFFYTRMVDTFDEMVRNNYFYIDDILTIASYQIVNVMERLGDLRQQYVAHFERKWEQVKTMLIEAGLMWERAVRGIQQAKNDVVDSYNYHKMVAGNFAEYYLNQLVIEGRSLWDSDLHEYKEKAVQFYENVCARYEELMEEARTVYRNVMSDPNVGWIKEKLEGFMGNMQWVYDDLNLRYILDTYVFENLNEDLIISAFHHAIDYLREKASMFSFQVISWEPSQGLYEFMMRVPFEWQNLRSMPKIPIRSYVSDIQEMFEGTMPRPREHEIDTGSFWDTYYAYMPARDPQQWIPPFEAHATIAGNQHFMTFDKKFYEFAGDCSYVLARDFDDGNFTVLVNYENAVKKSVSVITADATIEIQTDYKVMVGGSQAEMPLMVGGTTLTRTGDVVRVDNTKGLTVICDLAHDHCTVNVSGWYHSKTAGLFGTYNYEASDDFTKSDRSIASDIEDFAGSWGVNQCRTVNRAQVATYSESSAAYQECAKYLKNNDSPFRPCFGQVEPEQFMRMCINDVTGHKENAVCKVASFYVEECQREGVAIRTPSGCVKCNLGRREMSEGETIGLESGEVPRSADVIFVVSHGSCNEGIISRLPSLVEQMERNFQAADISGIRYGLVGYGHNGLLRPAHSHTFDGNLMTASHRFSQGLTNFDTLEESSAENAMSAVEFAARYPFRAGVAKAIVVIPCDSCGSMDSYSTIERMLERQNIQLHLLTQHNFRLRTASPKTSYIFGVDGSSLYTAKDVSDTELHGDADLRRQVEMPKDLCAALSEGSGGSLFNINQMTETRAVVQKRFTDVFTRLVVKKAAPRACQECECEATEAGTSVAVCRSCDQTPVQSWIQPEVQTPSRARGRQQRNRRV